MRRKRIERLRKRGMDGRKKEGGRERERACLID